MGWTVCIYENPRGNSPFTDWLLSLKDLKSRATIRARIERLRLGIFGDCKSVGDGVYELRIQFGPGFRVYFGQVRQQVVILLCGGDKSSQKRDIAKAKLLWGEYLSASKKLSR